MKSFTEIFGNKNCLLIPACLLVTSLLSCKEEPVDYSDNNCKTNAPFITRLGFNAARCYFSTSEKRTMGLVLIEANNKTNLAEGKAKQYQDSSWKQAGWLAPIQIDDKGNVFTGPAPFINVLDNAARDQNTVYRVDCQTGKMAPFAMLPFPDSLNSFNPFGIIGLIYLCETGSLYVSSIACSDRLHHRGAIYQLDGTSGKIISQLPATDALGMGIAYTSGQRRLYFGVLQTSDVYSVKLKKDGSFEGKAKLEFSLQGLGPRGDDKVRRIRLDKDGSLLIYGMEFNVNLVAPSEKQETIYRFSYDEETGKWVYVKK